jgi:hypothetical protein
MLIFRWSYQSGPCTSSARSIGLAADRAHAIAAARAGKHVIW